MEQLWPSGNDFTWVDTDSQVKTFEWQGQNGAWRPTS